MTVGRKGYEFLKSRYSVYKNFSNVLSKPNYQTAVVLAQEVIDGFVAGEYDQVELLYNSFRTVMTQDITFQQMLPVEPEEKGVPTKLRSSLSMSLLLVSCWRRYCLKILRCRFLKPCWRRWPVSTVPA